MSTSDERRAHEQGTVERRPLRDTAALELRLRRDAAVLRREFDGDALRSRVLERMEARPAPRRSRRRMWGAALSAAAAILVVAGALTLRAERDAEPAPERGLGVAWLAPSAMSGYLRSSAAVLEGTVEGPLAAELRALTVDAGQAAEGFLEGLPRPLRELAATARGQ